MFALILIMKTLVKVTDVIHIAIFIAQFPVLICLSYQQQDLTKLISSSSARDFFPLASRTPQSPSFPPGSLAAPSQFLSLAVPHVLSLNVGRLSSWGDHFPIFIYLVLFASPVAVSASIKLTTNTLMHYLFRTQSWITVYLTAFEYLIDISNSTCSKLNF